MMTAWWDAIGRLVDRATGLFFRLLLRLRSGLGGAPDPHIVAFDSYGTSEWLLVRGRVTEDPEHGQGQRRPVRRILARLRRGRIPGARIRASIGARSWETHADERGYFRLVVPSDGAPGFAAGWHEVPLTLAGVPGLDGASARTEARVLVLSDAAEWGVLSDVDDTLLLSHSRDQLAMARTVLLDAAREREALPGAAEFLRALARGGNGAGANPLFYHSTESWNLYEHIVAAFEQEELPRGPLFLRPYGAQGLLATSDLEHKVETAREVLETYPDLPLLMLGDSAGKDPEACLEIARAHPRRVRLVYLRRADDHERHRAVQEIAEEIRRAGVEVQVVRTVAEMAAHAAERGFIPEAGVPEQG